MNREPIDMSPRAVARRLDEVRDLFRLTEYLAKFRPVKSEGDPAEADKSGAVLPRRRA